MNMDHLSGSHALPAAGLTFRPYQGEQDLPAMLDVFRSTRTAGLELDHEDMLLETLADITNKYRHLSNCDPSQDVLVAEGNDQAAAFGRVHWRQLEASGDRIYSMEWYIRPESRGPGLEKEFLERCQGRLRQVIREQEAEPAPAFSGGRLFEVIASNLEPELCRLLEEAGFQAAKWGALMTCPDLRNIPENPMPEGMEVRPVKAEHYPQIWDALLDAFHDDPGYSEPSEDDYASWRQSAQFQPDLWQVAWEGSQITGMVLNYVSHSAADPSAPGTAWTEDICVRRPWRRLGLARALLARSMGMFRGLGFTQTSLGVDLNNNQGAPRLYESMGYRVVRSFITYRKPVDL
jgi:mycothiol synthase